MDSRLRSFALVLALGLYPQAASAEAEGAPIEHRLRIVLQSEDGTIQPRPTGGATRPAPAIPTVAAEALEPLALPEQEPPALPERELAGIPSSAELAIPSAWSEDALRTPLRAGEGWRIQVGAFRESASAEARIAELELTAAGPGADPVRVVVPAGEVYRAQMSGFIDRPAADAACARIAATGAGCFVVSPTTP